MTPQATRRVVLSVSMPAKSAEAVEKAAKREGKSLSRYICEAAEQKVAASVKERSV